VLWGGANASAPAPEVRPPPPPALALSAVTAVRLPPPARSSSLCLPPCHCAPLLLPDRPE
jgi:hypothetical protein